MDSPPARSPATGSAAAQNGSAVRIEAIWEHLETIVEASGDYFTLIDTGYVYQAVNDAYCRAHDISREEILGRTVAEVWGEDVFQSTLREPLDRCLHGAEVHFRANFEFPHAGLRHVEVSFHPFYNKAFGTPKQPPTHAVVVIRDITVLHNAEEQVRLLLLLAKAINQADDFDSALELVLKELCEFTGWTFGQGWCPSSDGEHLELRSASEITGDEVDEFHRFSREKTWRKGEPLPGMVWETGKAAWISDFSEDPRFARSSIARRLGLKTAMGIPVIAGDEVVAVMEFLLASPRPDDERLMGAVSATAEQLGRFFQKQYVETKLRESEKRFRLLIETANDVFFFIGKDGALSAMNRAFEVVTGWSRAEWQDKQFVSLLHPDDLPAAAERLRAAMEGAEHPVSEYRVRKADGDYAVAEFTMTPQYRDDSIQGLFGIGRDVTARKRAEEAVLQSEDHYRELFHHALESQQDLRRLSDRILRIQEEERTRISRDLHDEIGQSLTAVKLNLSILESRLTEMPSEAAQRLADIRDLVKQTMENVHHFSRQLRPAMLDDLGLIPALSYHTKEFTRRTGLPVHFRSEGESDIERLDSERKTVIFRVVQEGLNNVVKHARNAESIVVSIVGLQSETQLVIHDDGEGFNVDDKGKADEQTERLGLLGMAERVRLVNGIFKIESEVGKGTTLRATIPFSPVQPAERGRDEPEPST